MQSATEYLSRTESAVRRLFEGIDGYLSILDAAPRCVFITSEPPGAIQDAEFEAWLAANADKLAADRLAERQFVAESFALNTLCGAVLQVAEKALELYSSGGQIPSSFSQVIKKSQEKYCVGRTVRTVPLGLVIYAGRNQHAHFNESSLHEPSATVFRLLATAHGYGEPGKLVDPAFNIGNTRIFSYASNITSLIDWHSYEKYIADMRALLAT